MNALQAVVPSAAVSEPPDVGLVHYGEIALKGRNRPLFVRQLMENLRAQTDSRDVQSITHFMGRLVLGLRPSTDPKRLRERLSRVFGVNSFALAHECPVPLPDLIASVERLARPRLPSDTSFKVVVRRGDKSYPYTSLEVARELGDRLRRISGATVSLDYPDVTIFVELAGDRAFVAFERAAGLGGLPVGMSGRVLCLLSGGIDSAVAAWLMVKRGCTMELLHVHPYRNAEEVTTTKIAALTQHLANYACAVRLHLVPFFHFEQRAVSIEGRLGALLFRRFLLRLGETLARQIGATAIVTGDSLAQVASQTLPNLAAIDHGVDTLILRPLLTYDKNEIVDLSRQIGTYQLSLAPYKDCCSLLAPHPETHASPDDIDVLEELIDLRVIVDATLAEAHELEAFSEGSAPSPRPPLAGAVPAT